MAIGQLPEELLDRHDSEPKPACKPGPFALARALDDGPGLAAKLREQVSLRGVRADEKAAGSGLGLAIVRDLADLYRGSIALSGSPLGGLLATLTLPRIRSPIQ